MNFKKHAVLVSHVGKSCYVDAFHISSIVSWEVTQCHHMDPSQTRIHGLSKACIQATKNNSVLVFMFRPCRKSTLPKSHKLQVQPCHKSTLPKSHKLQVQRICCCWTPHISPWFQLGRHGSLKNPNSLHKQWLLQSPDKNMLAPLFCSFVWVIEAGPCHERP